MSDAGLIIAGVASISRTLLLAYFEAKRLEGKTEAEIEAEFNAMKATFKFKDPGSLPDV